MNDSAFNQMPQRWAQPHEELHSLQEFDLYASVKMKRGNLARLRCILMSSVQILISNRFNANTRLKISFGIWDRASLVNPSEAQDATGDHEAADQHRLQRVPMPRPSPTKIDVTVTLQIWKTTVADCLAERASSDAR